MIPLSGGIDKYRRIMEKKEKAGKPCDILYIVKVDDNKESTFLIQDMFPITEKYIEREYTVAGNHLMLTSEHTVREIEQKARKVMGILKHGIKFMPTQPDVTAISNKDSRKLLKVIPNKITDAMGIVADVNLLYEGDLQYY